MAKTTTERLLFTHYVKKGTMEAEVQIAEAINGGIKLELVYDGSMFDRIVISPTLLEALKAYLTD